MRRRVSSATVTGGAAFCSSMRSSSDRLLRRPRSRRWRGFFGWGCLGHGRGCGLCGNAWRGRQAMSRPVVLAFLEVRVAVGMAQPLDVADVLDVLGDHAADRIDHL